MADTIFFPRIASPPAPSLFFHPASLHQYRFIPLPPPPPARSRTSSAPYPSL